MKTLQEMIDELPPEQQEDIRRRAEHLIAEEKKHRDYCAELAKERWSIAWTKDGPRIEPFQCDQPWECVCQERDSPSCGSSLEEVKKEIGEYWKNKGQMILDMTEAAFLRNEGYGYPQGTSDD